MKIRMTAMALAGVFPALANFNYCQPIVIQHAKVSGSGQADYVMSISDTDPHLASVSNGGNVQSATGNDIVFASDSLGQNLLKWDSLEVYNPATGQIVTHVNAGAISSTTDTTIYRCVENALSGAFRGGTAGSAWPTTYRLVGHFGNNGGAVSAADSTASGNNGTAAGATSVAGILGSAASLNGGSSYVGVPNSVTLQISGQLTIAVWLKLNAIPSGYTEIFRKGPGYFLFADASPSIGLAINNDYLSAPNFPVPGASVGNWAQLVATYDSSNSQVKTYWNGALVSTRTTANTLVPDSSAIGIGALETGNGQFLNGSIDEVRLSSVALTADRIATDYRNQSSPSTFYVPGSWVAIPLTSAGGSQILIF